LRMQTGLENAIYLYTKLLKAITNTVK